MNIHYKKIVDDYILYVAKIFLLFEQKDLRVIPGLIMLEISFTFWFSPPGYLLKKITNYIPYK